MTVDMAGETVAMAGDPRTAAVHNNAVWCDAVCRALGCDIAWAEGLWLNRSPAPPYYSNALTVAVGAVAAQLDGIRSMLASPLPRPWTIKDGFSTLDLASDGFDVLFEASWLTLAPGAAVRRDGGLRWSAVTTPADLVDWEAAWRDENPNAASSGLAGLFQPVLLGDPDIRFLTGRLDSRVTAVVVANRSDDGTGPVVGISNIVVDNEAYRASAVQAVRVTFPGLPLVGYEWGDDLDAMQALGFRTLGPLRVWITSDGLMGG